MTYPHEEARTDGLPHERLTAFDRAATVVLWPALAEEGEKPWTVEDFAVATRELVWQVQKHRQQIAIRAQEDRFAEQVRLGYR